MTFLFLRFPGIFPHNYDHINEDIVFLEIDFDSLIVFCSISTLSSITEKKITKSLDIFEDSWRGFKFIKVSLSQLRGQISTQQSLELFEDF